MVNQTSIELGRRAGGGGEMYQGQKIVKILGVCVILTLISFSPIGKNRRNLACVNLSKGQAGTTPRSPHCCILSAQCSTKLIWMFY